MPQPRQLCTPNPSFFWKASIQGDRCTHPQHSFHPSRSQSTPQII